MVNLVVTPTRGSRILDVIVLNLHTEYDKAKVLPPIQPDKAGVGVPSDLITLGTMLYFMFHSLGISFFRSW